MRDTEVKRSTIFATVVHEQSALKVLGQLC
jgi:hypothetical protein